MHQASADCCAVRVCRAVCTLRVVRQTCRYSERPLQRRAAKNFHVLDCWDYGWRWWRINMSLGNCCARQRGMFPPVQILVTHGVPTTMLASFWYSGGTDENQRLLDSKIFDVKRVVKLVLTNRCWCHLGWFSRTTFRSLQSFHVKKRVFGESTTPSVTLKDLNYVQCLRGWLRACAPMTQVVAVSEQMPAPPGGN